MAMADPRSRVLTVRNVENISERLLLAVQKIRPQKLQADVFFASMLLFTLVETGVIDRPVELVWAPVDKPKRRCSGGGRRHG
jgi:hypothetical protein